MREGRTNLDVDIVPGHSWHHGPINDVRKERLDRGRPQTVWIIVVHAFPNLGAFICQDMCGIVVTA